MNYKSINLFGLFVILSVLLEHYVQARPQDIGSSTTEKSTWNKLKDGVEHGWNVAYDEVHCGFHKVKELVQHHDHQDGSDPCKDKPYQQTEPTSPKTIDLRIDDDIVPITVRGTF